MTKAKNPRLNKKPLVKECLWLVIILALCILTISFKIAACHSDTTVESRLLASGKRVGPAVVRIITKHVHSERMNKSSGMIIDPEGYIMTADFVVADAEDIKVILPDKREFKGEIKRRDERGGIAVIKISAKGLPVVEFGDSNVLKVRQFVMVAGYPGDANAPSFTIGVISALHRNLPASTNRYGFNDLIQTDAGMLPGFTGGPLVDMDGKVIGICIIELTRGIDYVIPINRVRNILEGLKPDKS